MNKTEKKHVDEITALFRKLENKINGLLPPIEPDDRSKAEEIFESWKHCQLRLKESKLLAMWLLAVINDEEATK